MIANKEKEEKRGGDKEGQLEQRKRKRKIQKRERNIENIMK